MAEKYVDKLVELEEPKKSFFSGLGKIPSKRIMIFGGITILILIFFWGKEIKWWVYIIFLFVILLLSGKSEEREINLISFDDAQVLLKRQIDLDHMQDKPELPSGRISYLRDGGLFFDENVGRYKWIIFFKVFDNYGASSEYGAAIWAKVGDVGFGGWMPIETPWDKKELLNKSKKAN